MDRKYLRTRILPLIITALMILSLTACQDTDNDDLSTDDAKTCVQVELDATYKGQFDGFLSFYNNVTLEDAQAQYDDNVRGEALFFLDGLGLSDPQDQNSKVPPSDLQVDRAAELYAQIYAKSDYATVSSTKQEDGTFSVKVLIRPLDVFDLVTENYDAGFEAFRAKYDAVDTESMSDQEFLTWYRDTFAMEFYDTLLDILEAQIPDIGYKADKSIVIQVQQDEEDGSLYISSEDWQNMDRLVIDYSGS